MAGAAPWGAGPRLVRTTAREVYGTSAAIGRGLEGAGPETDRQGNPEGAQSEGGACGGGQTAAGGASLVRDAGWVTTAAALADRGVEPDSSANEEKEASVGGGMLLIG